MAHYKHRKDYDQEEGRVQRFLRLHGRDLAIAALCFALAAVLLGDVLWAMASAAGRFIWHSLITTAALVVAALLLLAWRISAGASSAGKTIRAFFKRHGYTSFLSLLVPLACAAVLFTFTRLQVFAGHAVAIVNISIFIICFGLYDRLVFRDVDTFFEIRRANMAVTVWCSVVALIMAAFLYAVTAV